MLQGLANCLARATINLVGKIFIGCDFATRNLAQGVQNFGSKGCKCFALTRRETMKAADCWWLGYRRHGEFQNFGSKGCKCFALTRRETIKAADWWWLGYRRYGEFQRCVNE